MMWVKEYCECRYVLEYLIMSCMHTHPYNVLSRLLLKQMKIGEGQEADEYLIAFRTRRKKRSWRLKLKTATLLRAMCVAFICFHSRTHPFINVAWHTVPSACATMNQQPAPLLQEKKLLRQHLFGRRRRWGQKGPKLEYICRCANTAACYDACRRNVRDQFYIHTLLCMVCLNIPSARYIWRYHALYC